MSWSEVEQYTKWVKRWNMCGSILWTIVALLCGVFGIYKWMCNQYQLFYWLIGIAVFCECVSLIWWYANYRMLI